MPGRAERARREDTGPQLDQEKSDLLGGGHHPAQRLDRPGGVSLGKPKPPFDLVQERRARHRLDLPSGLEEPSATVRMPGCDVRLDAQRKRLAVLRYGLGVLEYLVRELRRLPRLAASDAEADADRGVVDDVL